jgi:predicted lipid-binding transport protein (Tim44 family)
MDISNYFRQDNTEGYADEQLSELNARLAVAIGAGTITDSAEDLDALKAAAEQIVSRFDTELATAKLSAWVE